jgi:hypothetical protein
MKPIEPGCMALVVNANKDRSMIGKVMKVTERAQDKDHFFDGNPAWRLDKPIPNLACEDWLIRIDDHDLNVEEQELEVEHG